MLDFLPEYRKRVYLDYEFIRDFIRGKIKLKKLIRVLQPFASELAAKGINLAKIVALKKAEELEKSRVLYFRFMNFDEFKSYLQKGEVKVLKWAVVLSKNFISFKNRSLRRWSENAAFFSAIGSGYAHEQYKEMEKMFIDNLRIGKTLLREGKIQNPRAYALKKLRVLLLNYLARGLKISFNAESENIDDEIQQLKKQYFTHNYFSGIRHDYFIGLLEDQDFLFKNQHKLKDIFLTFSGIDIEKRAPFHMVLFVRKNMFIYTGKRNIITTTIHYLFKAKENEWGFIEGNIKDQFLGCIVFVPSSSLCNQIAKLIEEYSKNDLGYSIPVYDTKGRIFWPR